MDQVLEFVRGPLFALTFGIMILGLLRLVVVQVYSLITMKGRRLRNAPWRRMATDALSWALPFRHVLEGRRTMVFTIASFVFHIGLIIVSVLLAEHVLLWERLLHIDLPAIGRMAADIFTVTTLVCLAVLLGCRIFIPRHRVVSRPIDYLLLLIIMVPFATGFMMMHASFNLFPWDAVMLVHMLSAELLFVLVPTTKLAHVVTFLFDRISAVHWQLRPGAGDKVAEALYGKEARV